MRRHVSSLPQHVRKLLTGEGLRGSYTLAVPREEAPDDRWADYRHMASEIRDLIPLLLHAQAVADLRLLADRYERLAHYLEVTAVKSPASIESPSSH